MKIKFDVTHKELNIIQDIFAKHLCDDCNVWVFGSRAKNTALFNSDLDLAIECKDKIDLNKLNKIKSDLEYSRLPYTVDLIDINAIKPHFKDLIQNEMIEFPLINNSNIPKLRFKDFRGEWVEKKLGSISTMFSGGTPTSSNKSYYSGNIPFIGSGNISDLYVNQFITENALYTSSAKMVCKGDLLYALYGATSGAVAISNIDGAINQAVLCIRSNENTIFLYNWLTFNKDTIVNTYLQGGQGNLSSKIVKELKLNLPTQFEQQKIASFLTSVDKKIELLTQKEKLLKDYKKGIMQKIFSQEIRFKADDSSDFPEWVEYSLRDFLIPTLREIPKPKKNYLAIGIRSHCKGTFQKPNSDPNKISMDKLFAVRENDLVVNITFAWESAIAIVKNDDEGGLVSHRFPTYIFDETISNSQYFKYVIIQKKFRLLLDLISPGGAGRNRVMSEKDFLKLKWKLPCLNEQSKVANFLSAIDSKIEQVASQLESTKLFKKALLQQMFV